MHEICFKSDALYVRGRQDTRMPDVPQTLARICKLKADTLQSRDITLSYNEKS